ncbi:Dedicator Of Cytokinesis Protein 3 [Manis pentadactyla]|nr:Dedicator Of Cytokinesis Protein 3 [Manis pentadactyla]
MDTTTPSLAVISLPVLPALDKAVGSTTAGLNADSDSESKDEKMDTTPPWLAVIFRSPPGPTRGVDSTTTGPKADSDAQDEPMDTTPPSLAAIFRSPPALHEATPTARAVIVLSPLDPQDAVGGTDDGLSPTPKSDDDPMGKAVSSTSTGLKADADTEDEPMDTMPPWLAVIFRSPLGPTQAVGSTSAGPKADSDAQDEPMDTTTPWLAVIFQAPPAPHRP